MFGSDLVYCHQMFPTWTSLEVCCFVFTCFFRISLNVYLVYENDSNAEPKKGSLDSEWCDNGLRCHVLHYH